MGISNNSLLSIFNKIVRQEIDVSNYSINKGTSNLQGSVFNSPLQIGNTVKGDSPSISNPISGYFGDFEVIDQGASYLITIEEGIYNGVKWKPKTFVINKFNDEELFDYSRTFIIYIDTNQKTLILKEVLPENLSDSTNFVIMLAIINPNAISIEYSYDINEETSNFIYGYEANFLYYLLMHSSILSVIVPELPANKIVGNLTIEGSATITSESESVLLTPDGMYIYDVANVESLGLDGDYIQSLLATFNKNGLFFYDGDGTLLSKFTKDEASIAGWVINEDSFSGTNIILYPEGGIETLDFEEGTVGEVGNEEGWSEGVGWRIASTGSAYFNNVTIFGTLYSSMGNIAGWEINDDYIANGNIVLASKGEIYTSNYIPEVSGWKIKHDGLAEFSNAIIRGALFSDVGYIGTWNIANDIISSHSATSETVTSNEVGTVTLTSDAVAIIYVRNMNTGQLYKSDQVTFTVPRTIEGLQVDTEHVVHYITAYDGIKLDASGSISANYVANTSGWSINSTGDAEFNTILIRDGDFQDGELGGNWEVTDDGKLQNGTDIVLDGANKSIYLNNKSTYASVTNGVFMGYDSTIPKVNIGNDTNYFKWTGTELVISGEIIAPSGVIGGWTIGATSLSSYGITLYASEEAEEEPYVGLGTTAYSDTGIWLGKDTSWKASFYNDANSYLLWDGSKLLIKAANFQLDADGNIIVIGGTIGGWSLDATTISAENIILDSTGSIETSDFSEGTFVASDYEETKSSTGEGTLALTYKAQSIIYVKVSGESVEYTFVPQTNSLTNLAPSTSHTIKYVRDTGVAGTGWKIESAGNAFFNDVTVFGTLYGTGGNIGGWDIGEGYIANGNIVLASSGEIYTANYNHRISGWKIRYDGFAEFNDVLVRGEIESSTGNIGGWLITSTTIESEGLAGIVMSSDGSIASKNFVIDTSGWKIFGDGTAEFGDVIIRSGSIAPTGELDGWTIGEGKLYNGTDIVLDANNKKIYFNDKNTYSSSTAGVFLGYDTDGYKVNIGDSSSYLKWSGTVLDLSGKITATDGAIGGWTIDTNSIYKGTDIILNSATPYIGVGTGTYSNAGIWLGKHSSAWKASFYADANNYLLWDGSKLTAKAANFELDTSGNITASNVDLSGKITASDGDIAGWTIDTNSINKGNVFLRSDESRFEISINDTVKLAVGYLDNINAELDDTNFGIYVGAADAVYIEADENDSVIQHISGDWLVKDDANILIKSGENTVLRLGKVSDTRGLFLYDASANVLASYTSSGVTINVAGTNMKIGNDVESTNDGIYIGATNYWYSDGSFKIGSAASYITGSSSGVAITSSGFAVTTAGAVTATSGTIGGWTIGSTTLTAGNITLDSAGSIKGNYTEGSAGWSIKATGEAEFNTVTIRSGNFENGTIGGVTGWTVTTGLLKDSTDAIVLDAANKKVSVGTHVALGSSVVTSNYAGLKITANNYWETNGTYTKFSVGSGKFSYDDSTGEAVVSVEGEIKATSGYIGNSTTGWKIGSTEIYAGTSTSVYSLLLDSNNTKIGIHRPSDVSYPAVSLGMSVLTDKHGLAFYDNTDGSSNNYWVWDTNEVKFKVGDATNYIDFNVGTSSKLSLKTDTFELSSNSLTLTSGSSPYIGLGITTYDANSGIWLGKDTAWKLSIKNSGGTEYLKWDGSKLTAKAANFELDADGKITAADVDLSGKITATDGAIGGWKLTSSELYSGTSTSIYSMLLDSATSSLNIYRASGWDNPSVKIGYSAYDSKHGIAMYGTSGSSSNNYWVWDSSTLKFKMGDATNYIDFNVTTSSKLYIKTDTFELSSNSLIIKSGTNPYIVLGAATYGDSGIWIGRNSSAWQFSLYNSSTNYLKWDGTNLDLNVDNKFKVSSAGAVTATSGTIGGWTLSSNLLSASNTYIQAGSSPYISIKATDLMQKGIWFGESSFVGSLIPFLQSNTRGDLEVSASISSDNVWLAFNGNPDIVWNSGTHSDAAINIDVDFGENTLVNCVQIYFPDQSLSSKTFSIQGSSDGSSWTTISASFANLVGHSGWYSASLLQVYTYRYYRVLFPASSYTGTSLILGQINFKLTAVYPETTSKVTSSIAGSLPEQSMDLNLSASWYGEHSSSSQTLSVELKDAREISSYRFYCNAARYSYNPKSWTFEGSNNNTDWTVLHTVSNHANFSSVTWYSYTCTVSGVYKYYRWVFTAYRHATYVALTEIELLTSDNYGFSISNGAESYMYWDRKLKLKGDLYLGEGANGIYFEDTGLSIEDGFQPTLAWTLDTYLGLQIKNQNKDTLFGFLQELNDGNPLLFMQSINQYENLAIYPYGISIYNKDVSDYSAIGNFDFTKLAGNYNRGYFSFNYPIKVLYGTGADAAQMPNGSILVQGNYLYYRDSSGTWRRLEGTSNSPS